MGRKKHALSVGPLSVLWFISIFLLAAPAFADNQITTADEYRKKYAVIREKAVQLPSGAVFKITSIDQRALNQLLARQDLSMDEYKKLVHKKMNDMSSKEFSRYMDFWEAMIVLSVVAPKMCVEPEPEKLEIRLLTPADLDKLQQEIAQINQNLTQLPMKPLSAAPEKIQKPQYTVSRLVKSPQEYDGKTVEVFGEVEGELSDIGIVPRQGHKIGMQRFYLSDGKNKILICRFHVEGDRIQMDSILRDIFKGDDEPVTIRIKNGTFKNQWIDEPVVITHGQKIDRIRPSWIQKARKAIEAEK
jgi:hypothetical protein